MDRVKGMKNYVLNCDEYWLECKECRCLRTQRLIRSFLFAGKIKKRCSRCNSTARLTNADVLNVEGWEARKRITTNYNGLTKLRQH